MLQFQKSLLRLFNRFRYPVSLPEDVAKDLGLVIPNTISLVDFIRILASPNLPPTKLKKFMSRSRAEAAFQSSIHKESFRLRTLFSYYLGKHWVVITLFFDEEGLLRRATLQLPEHLSQDYLDLPLQL